MYLTTLHVETFVEEHLQHQIDMLEPPEHADYAGLRAALCRIRDDEAHHKEEGERMANGGGDSEAAASAGNGDAAAAKRRIGPVEYVWASVISVGSKAAVLTSRWV